ncbi:MAG: rhombosortase [Planctomycetota bacterium]|nr:MAG: rhombosortase [Planctomycetota bacterium]
MKIENNAHSTRIENTIICLFFILLVCINTPLFSETYNQTFSFNPTLLLQGEYWRFITHPFVHISFYHLLTDTLVLVILWSLLQSYSFAEKLLLILTCLIGSLIGAWAGMNHYQVYDYSGLSGINYGLIGFICMQMMRQKQILKIFKIGVSVFYFSVLLMSIIELTIGSHFLSSIHLGNVGTPIISSHLAGIITGTFFYFIIERIKTSPSKDLSPLIIAG